MSSSENVISSLSTTDNQTIHEFDNEIFDLTNVNDKKHYDIAAIYDSKTNISSIVEVNATAEIDSFYFYEVCSKYFI